MLRWLLPLIAAMALLGSSVTTWAAAGFVGDPECCCPVKKDCKCHDHDDEPADAPTMKRCGGAAMFVAPLVVAATPTAEPPPAIEMPVTLVTTSMVEPIPDERTLEIETPPF